MTTIEIEEKLSGLFHHGEILEREVRLTPQEVTLLAEEDGLLLSPLGQEGKNSSPSSWYKVQVKGAFSA